MDMYAVCWKRRALGVDVRMILIGCMWNGYVRSMLEEKSTRRRCEDDIKVDTALGVCGLDSCAS